MFSSSTRSWSRIVLIMGIVALGVSSLLLTGGTAVAYEGIQGQYAIFYPAVELLYYHTDNLFLTPSNETSADTFLVRVPLKLEIPTDRHYFMLEYVPQFRDIDDFDLQDQWSHFVNLKGSFQGSPSFRVDIVDNFARGVLEVDQVDPDGELYLGLDPFMSNFAGVNFIWEGQRQGANLSLDYFLTDFDRDQPTAGDPAPAFLEQNAFGLGITYFYKFTPLSRFEVGYRYQSSTQDYAIYDANGDGIPDVEIDPITGLCVGGPCLGVPDVDSTSNGVWVGFSGELGRTSTGQIRLGYRSTDYDDSPERISTSDFSSLTLDGTFTKAFTRYTKLEINLHRGENFSNFENNSWYTGNRISLALTNQPMGRRVFWTVAGGFQRNDYPDPVDTNFDGEVDTSRQDDIWMARAEVGYFPITHLNVKLNYRFEDRNSNMPNNGFDYEENAVIFELGLGF